MKREIITIGENGKVHIPTTPVWMSACEIATLFGVFSGKVSSHIKSILKEGLLREDEVMQMLLFKGGAVDLYNIEMITMLDGADDRRLVPEAECDLDLAKNYLPSAVFQLLLLPIPETVV